RGDVWPLNLWRLPNCVTRWIYFKTRTHTHTHTHTHTNTNSAHVHKFKSTSQKCPALRFASGILIDGDRPSQRERGRERERESEVGLGEWRERTLPRLTEKETNRKG